METLPGLSSQVRTGTPPAVSCTLHCAEHLERSYLIRNLDNDASASSQQVNLGSWGVAATVLAPPHHPHHDWAQQLEVAPQVDQAKPLLSLVSFDESNSNSAHSTSWSVDLVDLHKNYIHQSVHGHQSNALEVAHRQEDVQNPRRRSPQVPDPVQLHGAGPTESTAQMNLPTNSKGYTSGKTSFRLFA